MWVTVFFKPHANGSNIVGCYMLRPFARLVACCWMLLGVVVQSSKAVKLWSQQPPTFLLFLDRRSVTQQCWNSIRLHSSSNIVGATHAHYTWLQSLMGWILPTMDRRSQHCLESLHLFAHHCRHGRNSCQHSKTNNIGSCCVRLHVASKDECCIYSPYLPWTRGGGGGGGETSQKFC